MSDGPFFVERIDYEAAAVEWIGATPPDDYPGGQGGWNAMVATVIDQTLKPIIEAALVGKREAKVERDTKVIHGAELVVGHPVIVDEIHERRFVTDWEEVEG